MLTPVFRLCLALLALSCLSLPAAAQKSAPDAFAGEAMVIERLDVLYAMNADGTGYQQRTVAVKLQSQAALQQMGVLSLGFAGASEHVEFHYVRVRRPDGTVTETPVSGVMEQPQQATVAAPFYSDLKVAQIPVKNLQLGDTLEWEARVVRTRAEAPNEFWGADSFVPEGTVVREESIELRVPAAKTVTVWTNPTLGLKPKESRDGEWKVYRWETAVLKPTVGTEADAAREAKKKHVLTAAEELDQEQGLLPSAAWTTFPSWEAVGAWYRALEESRTAPDEEIRAKVAELTAGHTSQEDKLRAVYAYVATQVRYIGVAFGVGRYQPHQAVEVLHNQYGDCKDKATLLAAMLGALGVPSDAVLIGAGVRFNEAVPSPASFNHLITHLKLNGKDVWLDSTEEVAPYGMMFALLRDRTALLVPATGAAILAKTPAKPPFDSFQTWTAKGSLDGDGVSDSQITLVERGDTELVMRAALRQIGPSQYDEFAQRLLGAIGYGGKESHAQFSRPEDIDEPFKVNFGYHREKAGDWDNLRIIPQLAPLSLPAVDEKEPPVQSLELGAPRTETSTAEMKLPDGWTAELPEAVHEKSAFASYDLTYRLDKGTLYSERKLVVLQAKVPPADWKSYKKFADAVGVGNETYVQLRRKGGGIIAPPDVAGGAGAGASKPIAPDASAGALIQQAMMAAQKWDLASAQAMLDKAKTLNKQERRLWAAYGYLAIAYGKANEAIEDFRKELQFYPDSYEVYGMIANAQEMHHDLGGAEQSLQTWASADTKNPMPPTLLAQVEFAAGRYAEAKADAEKALALGASNERLKLLLGESELKLHADANGATKLKALLEATEDPSLVNDAAYTLAEAGQELALDEAKQRAALEKLTAETESWTLDEAPPMLKQKTALLLAGWDTMGWILYKEGRLKEAESYLEAARLGRPDPTVLGHLAKLRAQMAKAAAGHGGDPDASKTEQQLRTIALGPSGGRRGVAEYRLLLWHGQIERSEQTGSDKLAGGDELLKAAKLPRFFPQGSEAKLVRQGMVNCVAGRCELVLEP